MQTTPAKKRPERVTLKITPSQIEAHRAAARAKGEARVLDDTAVPGLWLYLGPRADTWFLNARPRGLRPDGKRYPETTINLGSVRELSPDDARAKAFEVKRAVRDGENPTAEKRAARAKKVADASAAFNEAERRAALIKTITEDGPSAPSAPSPLVSALDFSVLADATLEQCAKAFVKHGAGGDARHKEETERALRLGLQELGAAGEQPRALTPQRLNRLAKTHADGGSPATAIARVGAFRRLYAWLMAEEAATTNPAAAVKLPKRPEPRTRVLTAREVQALWNGADKLRPARRDFLRAALLIPFRRQELADVRRSYIRANGDRLEIVLPPSETKNGKEFIMPLAPQARAIIERLLADGDDRGLSPDAFLFPLTRDGSPMNAWRRFSEDIERACGVHLNLHDTRRLFASELGEHEIGDFALVDGLLNHASSAANHGASRHYHHAKKAEPRTRIMAAWASLIEHAAAYGRWPREGASAEVIPFTKVGVA